MLHVFQHTLYNIINVFNFNCFKSFTSDDIFNIIEIKQYMKIETFVNIKKFKLIFKNTTLLFTNFILDNYLIQSFYI